MLMTPYYSDCSSSVVQCCLIDAHKSGKRFRVVVVNSRPKMEGICMPLLGACYLPKVIFLLIFLIYNFGCDCSINYEFVFRV